MYGKYDYIVYSIYISICLGMGSLMCRMVDPVSLGLKGVDPYGLGMPMSSGM